jgi:hypothetical protein
MYGAKRAGGGVRIFEPTPGVVPLGKIKRRA